VRVVLECYKLASGVRNRFPERAVTTTILVHGWSDTGRSFKAMKAFLSKRGIADVEDIYFGEYESREDALTFDDIVDGFHERMMERGFIGADGRAKQSVNVVVHSTGGLVLRHWIWRYYLRDARIGDCPVKRLVMLAPANFGSPLAHRGKSFFGALAKGRKELGNFLETGRTLLDGLELASPYQWRLAERDTLGQGSHFTPTGIQLTILTGVEPYGDLRRMVSKPGTDGTIVIAGAPLNSILLRVTPTRYAGDDPSTPPYRWSGHTSTHDFAFGVLPGLDHGSIVSSFDATGKQTSLVSGLVLKALQTRSAREFAALKAEVAQVTADTYRATGYPQYQQFLVRVRDDHEVPVRDFTLAFGLSKVSRLQGAGWRSGSGETAKERTYGARVQEEMVREAHANRSDAAYRRFLVNPAAVQRLIADAATDIGEDVALTMRVYVPPVDGGIRYANEQLQAVALAYSNPKATAGAPTLLYPNTTTLVDIGVDRKTDYVWIERTVRTR